MGADDVHEHLVQVKVQFPVFVSRRIYVQGNPSVPSDAFVVQVGIGNFEMGPDTGKLALGKGTFTMGGKVQDRVGTDFLQDREVLLIGLEQFAQGAVLDGGIGPDAGAVPVEDDVPESGQADGGHIQSQAVDEGLQGSVRAFGEGSFRVNMDRNPHPPRQAGGQECFGIGGQRDCPVFTLRFQMLQPKGQRIRGKASVEEETVGPDPAFGSGKVMGVQPSFCKEVLHRDQAQQRILLVGIYDPGPVGQLDTVYTDGRFIRSRIG